jgi:inhibitor of nuclear factor kappa-B kinase subunit alpha
MAQQMNVSRESMRRMVRSDLHLKPLKMRKTHMLNSRLQLARMKKCQQLLSRYAPEDCKSILFSDEKIFNVEVKWNRQNDRVLAANVSDIPPGKNIRQRTQHPASVMVWAGVSDKGKTPLVFIPEGVKVNKEIHISLILEQHVKPLTSTMFNSGRWTFQQDSAPSHRAKATQDWCGANLPNFISTVDWPASSPDLNPLDYGIWSILEQKACAINHSSVSQLKRSLTKAWEEIPVETVRATISQWRTRLGKCVRSKGGHFEH